MKPTRLLLGLVFLCAFSSDSPAREPASDQFVRYLQQSVGTAENDLPPPKMQKAQLDTVWFGFYELIEGEAYAVEGETWSWDHGAEDPMEGWYGVDLTENTGDPWWKRMSAKDYECPESAPMINDTAGQIWIGREQAAADAGCWVCDAGLECSLGYENDLCQRIDSPILDYSGGDLAVEFLYFLDCEGYPYDYVKVQLVAIDGEDEIDVVTLQDVNDDPDGSGIIGDPGNPVAFVDTLGSSSLPSETDAIRVRFEFVADGGWSDEDNGGGICSTYGPFGADDITVSELGVGQLAHYSFDVGDEGWVASHCPGVGDFVDVNPSSQYQLLDPCFCPIEENLLSMHDENFEHPGDPNGQANRAVSPIIDRRAYPFPEYNGIFVEYDINVWLPLEDGVFYRPGWYYYPWRCPQTGEDLWKYQRRTVDPPFPFGGCGTQRSNAVTSDVPPDAQFLRLAFDLLSCCSCFGITDCTGESNETPLFDNVRVGVTSGPDAPVICLDTIGLQDGFSHNGNLSSSSAGRSDDADADAGVEPPYILSDSLTIAGPVVGGNNSPWEAHLWFRVARKGPGQNVRPEYWEWKNRLQNASFPGDPEAGFVGVRMDSSMLGDLSFSNKYCSFAHPEDGFFNPAFGDRDDRNEILPDDAFTPGTKIEYFVTANYLDNPERFYLPDTSGGRFYEFEILPGMRLDGNNAVWPCVLYIDAFNAGAQRFIDAALDSILDVPGEGPDYDRYDELLANSNYNASSFYRLGPGANNGATLHQLLGYRVILVNTGTFSAGAMEETDMIGLEDWLLTRICSAPLIRQGLIMNGDEVAAIVEHHRPSLLLETLGAVLECSPYREADCPSGTDSDSSFCVAVIDASTGGYPPAEDYYALGNGCPNVFEFSVLGATEGIGNRDWWDYDGTKGEVSFAQVINDRGGGLDNYRSVIDGYSYHHITTSFDQGTDECEVDFEGRVIAIANEIGSALDWIFEGIGVPSFCVDPCYGCDVQEIDTDVRVNRLHPNRPNPFNPRTTIRFSVARTGPVELAIYDVGGRLVRTVIDKTVSAGLHAVVWDGMDNKGHVVGSGIYWSQLEVGDYVSSKKLVLLK